MRNGVWNWRAMCLWRHPSYICESPHLVWCPPAGGTLECFPNLALGGRDVFPKHYLLIRLYRLVSVTMFADNIHGLWLGSGTVRPGRPQTLGRLGYWQLLNAVCMVPESSLKKKTGTGNGTGNEIGVRLGLGRNGIGVRWEWDQDFGGCAWLSKYHITIQFKTPLMSSVLP